MLTEFTNVTDGRTDTAWRQELAWVFFYTLSFCSAKAGGVMWSLLSVSHSVCLSVCHYASRITHERGNGCRPNVVSMSKEWPSRILVLIRSRMWIMDHFFLSLTSAEEWILGDFLAFSYTHRPTCTKLGEMTDDDEVMNTQHFRIFGSIQQA